MTKPLFLALALLAPLPAVAGPLSDLVMAPGLFAAAPEGPLMTYAHDRDVPEPLGDLAQGLLRVAMVAGERGPMLAVTREEGGATRPVADFPVSGPNPVLLYFLESTARAMAEATGGSPFYIRNRMREALAAAGLGGGTTPEVAVLRPFAEDPNRGRMGVFSDLAISLRFDPAEPARLLELSADTAARADGYHDRLVLIAED